MSLALKEHIEGNRNNFLESFGGANNISEKLMNRFFRRVDGVVWDLMTGRVGIQTADGVQTLDGQGEDATVVTNILDQFSMPVPAFAQQTPVESVALGDLIYNNQNSTKGWVIKINDKSTPGAVEDESTTVDVDAPKKISSFRLISPSGTISNWKPPSYDLLGFGSGVMVLRSLLNMLPGGKGSLNSMQGMMMPLLLMGGDNLDLDKMMPMMLLSQMGTLGGENPIGGGGNQMMQTMLMMQMFKGRDKSGGGGFFE